MNKPAYLVDATGRPVVEAPPRQGDSLDVGFGGPIGNLMEKLSFAKQIMNITDEQYPYQKTGTKKTGKLTAADDEIKKANSKSIRTLSEEMDDNYEPEVPQRRQIPKAVQNQTPIAPKNKKPLYEDDNYVYYAKDGVQEDDEYDVRSAPSLTSELLMATKEQGQSKSLPDMSASVNEQMVNNSKLPDFIKQSFLKNPLTPPKLSAAFGGGNLDAITEQFRKNKMLANKENVQAIPKNNLIAVPKKRMVEQTTDPANMSKREKIKAQLRPIVEELIREILLTKL